MSRTHQVVGLGGTFDHFHRGHAHFLSFASQIGKKLLIGVTAPQLSKTKRLAHLIESYKTRVKSVKHYCNAHNIHHEIVELTDQFGPTVEKNEVQALCVTEATVQGAKAINELRRKLTFHDLPVFVTSLVPDVMGQPIASTRIRAGEINRDGVVYRHALENSRTLTETQRQFFSQLHGTIVSQPNTSPVTPIYVVGDTTLERFIAAGWRYNLGVYDQVRARSPHTAERIDSITPEKIVENPPGTLSSGLTQALTSALKKRWKHIRVQGEEDLAVVALTLLLPLKSSIYFGQPDAGMVELVVTEKKKNSFYEALMS